MDDFQLHRIRKSFDEYGLPDYMWGGLERYLKYGILPGGFLTAVLENNLSQSFSRADSTNQNLMKEWVGFVYMYVPAIAWGSSEDVKNWVKYVQEKEEA